MAGRKRKPDAQKIIPLTVGLYADEYKILRDYADEMGVSMSYAARVHIRSGHGGPARSPFTPEEDAK